MASSNESEVCADIERHLKALILDSGNKQNSTPQKAGQKYEENFPPLASGRSPGPPTLNYQNARTPENSMQCTPPRGNRPRIVGGYLPSTPEMNGYDYFKGKEIATLKSNPVGYQSPVGKQGNLSNSQAFSQNESFNQDALNVQLEMPVEDGVQDHGDFAMPGRQGQSKQKKRIKKKKEKKEQAWPDQEPKSVLSKQPVQKAAAEEVPSVPDGDRKDLKRNRNKVERPRKIDYNSSEMKLVQEIAKEKQRFMKDHEARNQRMSLEERLALVDPELKKNLKLQWLLPLEKPSTRFPDALFYCHLCNYHCNMENFQRHINHNNHVTLKAIRDGEIFLQNLPYPAEAQCAVLTKLLERVADEHGLSPDDLQLRQEVANRLTSVIQENGLNECKFQIFGSSLSGFATKDSDLNLDLIYTSLEGLPMILSKLQQILKDYEHLSDVNTDLEAKMPKIFFKDTVSGLKCDVSWNSNGTVQTSRLLCRYRNLDPRVHVLGVAFKLWAEMCGVDKQEKGTLPSHCYAIMLVYFLQQIKPSVLPVLHEVEPNMDPENPPVDGNVTGKWKCLNTMSVGELWIELFRFYGITFKTGEHVVCLRFRKKVTRAEKKWSGKVIAIEDPYFRKRNLSRCIPNQVVFRYIQERFRETYKYLGVPQTHKGPLFESLSSDMLGRSRKGRPIELSSESSNASSQDEQNEDDNADRQDWRRRRRRKHSENARVSHDFDGHDTSSSDDELLLDQDPDITLDDLRVIEILDLGESGDDRQGRTESESSDACLPQLAEHDTEHDNAGQNTSASPSRTANTGNKVAEKAPRRRPDSPPCEYIVKMMKSFSEKDLNYKFDKEIFTNSKSPPIYCGMCGEENHLKDDCPTQVLPELIRLHPLPQSYMKKLDQACAQVIKDHAPMTREREARDDLLDSLLKYVKMFYPDAKLELFGSSCNGFVFAGSDMDICLTFNDKKGENFDHGEIIGNLAQQLENNNQIQNILPITTAKVPIVKFNYKNLNVECDISLYNTLAQHNTHMLLAYCNIDNRVQQLGYTMKLFAKLCDIGDASRGSLSSYAYILMVLYYLQQRNPPVIPVLQELYPKDQKPPELIVDGWNAWFYQDLDNLQSVWPDYGKNKESIGELWIGLLRFYTETFNFKEHVVSIRQKALLTRIEKVWNAKMICIEDPFDLNHNLGVGVSRKMSIYIMKALIRGRELFGTPHDHVKHNLKKYLFDSRKLVIEPPPNDRGCRACGKIGHKVKDCPFRRNPRPLPQNRRPEQPHQQYSQHDRQRGVSRDNQQKINQSRMQAVALEGNPLNQNSARLQQSILRHLNLRQYPEQHQQQQQFSRAFKKQRPQNIQLSKQQQMQQIPQHAMTNQNRGPGPVYGDNKPPECGNFSGPLPVGVHPLRQMPMPQPSSPSWSNTSPRPSLGLPSPPQLALYPPSVLERTPRRDNTNPAQPSSPIQGMPQTSLSFYQGPGSFPLGFPMGTTVSPLNTQAPMHGLLYPQQQNQTPPKPVGREEPPMMCRPPAPPPFTHWLMNGPGYAQAPSQPPPPQPILNPNSPMRPMVIPGTQVMGSPQALLGTSPQQMAAALPPLVRQFQHNPEKQ